jgi:ubiquinone/menaquinone biosynthesis C-methylase UbiE
MDADSVAADELARSLRFIERVNRWLRYTHATLGHLKRFAAHWSPGQRVTILDIATGSGDVPAEILKWATAAGHDVSILGIDRHDLTLHAAASRASGRFRLVRADALSLPFEPESFDYVNTSMFLHHLSDDEALQVMRSAGRIARSGVIVADLLRNARAHRWIKLLTLFSTPIIRHDAAVSVRQAFSESEILRLRDAAGLHFTHFHRHFGHRFVLAGEKIAN